jgi:hypothetical protein
MQMNRWAPIVIAAALGAFACKKTEVGNGPVGHADLGSQAAGVANDTQLLAPAQAAAGEVVRNASDCAKARAAAPSAFQAISDAEAKAQTSVGRLTLDGLKKQVQAIVDACPAS